MIIRRARDEDFDAIWQIIAPVIAAGETYSFDRDMDRDAGFQAWMTPPHTTYVAEIDNKIAGTYNIKRNRAGGGGHVCNAGYMVADWARGRGLASAMCEHSQREAKDQGYRAMQYNCVVSTNTGAVRLWKKHGFDIVGTLPKAFHHPTAGYVDAYVMYKSLMDEPE